MRRTKLNTVAYEYAIQFEDFCPKIEIDKKHGDKETGHDG